MASARDKAQKIIDENKVVVFSKSYCPYCRATKSLLNEKHADFFLMELDQVGMSPVFPDADGMGVATAR
jgi:glutaredoxin 3